MINTIKEAKGISVTITADDLKEFARDIVKETISGLSETEKESPIWLTPDQVAKRLKVTRCTLWRWNKEGYLPNCKFGNRTRYKLSDVERVEEAEKGGENNV